MSCRIGQRDLMRTKGAFHLQAGDHIAAEAEIVAEFLRDADEGGDVLDFLGADGVGHGVGVPVDLVALRAQGRGGALGELQGHDRVLRAVGHEDGHVAVGRAGRDREDRGDPEG